MENNIKKIKEEELKGLLGGMNAPLPLVARLYDNTGKEVTPIGIGSFDEAMAGGWRGGELVVVSGPTKNGKTSYCQYLSANLARQQVKSLWFSYEMNPFYLNQKFTEKMVPSQNKMKFIWSPVELVENNLEQMFKQAQDGKARENIKVIFIDHLHYLIPLGNNSENTSLLIGGIARELKKFAVREDMVVVLIAHSRRLYQNETLGLSAIRDSAMVACEADYVFMVDRKPKSNLKTEYQDEEYDGNIVRVALAANRRTGSSFRKLFLYSDGVFGEYVAPENDKSKYKSQ